jgi:hypothetical protein
MSVVDLLKLPFQQQFTRVYGPTPASDAPPEEPIPEAVTIAEAEQVLCGLKEAGAPIAAKVRRKPELARGPDLLSSDSARRFLAAQAGDADQAVAEATEGKPLSCLNFEDPGRTHRALFGGPPAPERVQIGAIELVGRRLAALRAQQTVSDYQAVVLKLCAADLKIAKALLAFRQAWQDRIDLAQSAPRPENLVTRPCLKVTSDLNRLFLALRGAKTPEDLL